MPAVGVFGVGAHDQSIVRWNYWRCSHPVCGSAAVLHGCSMVVREPGDRCCAVEPVEKVPQL